MLVRLSDTSHVLRASGHVWRPWCPLRVTHQATHIVTHTGDKCVMTALTVLPTLPTRDLSVPLGPVFWLPVGVGE